MEQTIKKRHVQINGRELLEHVAVAWPTQETLQEMLFAQLERSGVKRMEIDFRIEPVVDETAQEVDLCFAGDVTVTLQCYLWNEIKKGEDIGKEEKAGE